MKLTIGIPGYEYKHEVKLLPDIHDAYELSGWCMNQKSEYNYSYSEGGKSTVINPSTFQPFVRMKPHRFYFEREEDMLWFIMRWS